MPSLALSEGGTRVFISYGRRDAKELADRLAIDLRREGLSTWLDTREIAPGSNWQGEIADGLRSAQVVIALMTPHSVRTTKDKDSPDAMDSVCLAEIAWALFNPPPQPVVPVMVQTCEPPLAIFHLDFVDLRAWSESEDRYREGFQRLLDGIQAARRGEKRYRSWHHSLDPFDFASFLWTKQREFSGRRWLFDAIDAWRCDPNGGPALLIKGDPGTGKSAIVAELVHRNPDGQVLAYHCCQWDLAATLEPRRFVRSLAAMIAGTLEEYSAQLADPLVRKALDDADPAFAFEHGLLNPLQRLRAPAGGNRYLLVDALDEVLGVRAATGNIVTLLASRLGRLPPWLRVVATTRKDPAVLDLLGGLRAREIDAQSAENRDDLRAWLRKRLDGPALSPKVAATGTASELLVDLLLERSAGNFLYAQQALEGIERGQYGFETLDRLPPGLSGLFAQRFTHLFPDERAFASARQVLEAVSAAREPLTVAQLAAATGLDPTGELHRVIESLASYLPLRSGADGEVRCSVYHKALADWFTDTGRSGKLHAVNRREGHRRFADLGWGEYQKGVRGMTPYTLRHLAVHLVGDERWEEASALLSDMRYVAARCAAGQVFELQADYRLLLDSLPESRSGLSKRKEREEGLKHWTDAIIAYSRQWSEGLGESTRIETAGRPRLSMPESPAVSPLWTDEQLVEERRRVTEEPDRVDVLSDYAAFLNAECYPLINYGSREGFVVQHAFGHAPAGPVHAAAAEQLSEYSIPLILRRWPRGAIWIQRPALQLTLEGHLGEVIGVGVAPDGARAVSGSEDGTLRVWNLAGGECLRTLEGHAGSVWSVSMTPDSRRAVSGSADGTLRVWDLVSGRCLHVLEGHHGDVLSVSLTPDGRQAVSGGMDQTVRVWDTERGRCRLTLSGHNSAVRCVSVTPDGLRAVSGSNDKTVRVWDLKDENCRHVLEGHIGGVHCVGMTPDGRYGVSGSHDCTLRIWDLVRGQFLRPLEGHRWLVRCVSVTPDGRRAVSGSDDKTVRVWDITTGQCQRLLEVPSDSVRGVSVTADGNRAVTGSDDRALRVWDLEQGQRQNEVQGHKRWVTCMSVTPDGRHAVSESYDGTLRAWDLDSGNCLATLEGRSWLVRGVGVTPDGRCAISGGLDGALRIWGLEDGRCLRVLDGHDGEIWCLSVTPDGRRVVSGSKNGTLRVWDVGNGQCLQVMRDPGNAFCSLSVTSDGNRAVSENADGSLRAWDFGTGTCIRTLSDRIGRAHRTGRVDDCKYPAIPADGVRPDGKATRGQSLYSLGGRITEAWSVSVTPDGRRAISARRDRALGVWDIESGQCLLVLDGHRGDIRCVDVSPDGRHVISGSIDRTLRLWDLESGECLAVHAVSAGVSTVRFAGSSSKIFTGTVEGAVLILDVLGNKPVPGRQVDNSDESYVGLLRRGLEAGCRRHGLAHEDVLAHRAALAAHLEKLGRTEEARVFQDEHERLRPRG